MKAFLGKKYTLQLSKNVNAFLDAMEVDKSEREGDQLKKSTIYLSQRKDGTYVLTATAQFNKKISRTFKSGVEYTVPLTENNEFKTTSTVVRNNTIRVIGIFANGKRFTINYKFSDDYLEIVYRTGKVVARRMYKSVN